MLNVQVANKKYRGVLAFILESFVEHVSHLSGYHNLGSLGSQTVLNIRFGKHNYILSTDYLLVQVIPLKYAPVFKNKVMGFISDLQILKAFSKIFCVLRYTDVSVDKKNYQCTSYEIKLLATLIMFLNFKIPIIANLGEIKSPFICGVNL